MRPEREEIAGLIGSVVVVDTASPYVYVGTLKDWQDNFLVLSDVDVHDTSEGRSGKELYILEARRNGVQKNRREAIVRKSAVLGLSRLDDIILF